MRTSTISNKTKVLISAVSVRILWMLTVVLLGFGVAMAQNPKPVQTFYVPFPEDDVLTALRSITPSYTYNGIRYDPVDPMHAYLSIAVFAENTVIYYDQWENGFDEDIANPANIYSVSNPGGTQIWGDGDPSNGYPPGYPEDVLSAGDIIHIHDDIVSAERGANIYYDGGDKIGSTKPIAVTKAAWASGSVTMFAVANEVYDTKFFGTEFRSPVGENIPQTVDYQMFEYAGFMIMAGSEGATVQIDADNNGTFETTVTLEEGETWLVNGGVNVGGHIVADKPIQVELITGDKGSSFESRTVHLMPTALWSSSATSPVATRSSNATTVWLYNPHATPLSVNYIYRSNNSTLVTNSITVPAGGTESYFRQVLTQDDSGARFIAPDGRSFYAMAAIDSNDSTYSSGNYTRNQLADWGFTLIADDALTPQALVGCNRSRVFL